MTALVDRLEEDGQAARQIVGRFFDGFIAIIERTVAEACER